MEGEGVYVATFRVHNTQIAGPRWSFLGVGEPLDTGYSPSVVDDWFWFPPSIHCSVFQIVAAYMDPTVCKNLLGYLGWY